MTLNIKSLVLWSCVCVCVCVRARARVCDCVCDRERESLRVYVCEGLHTRRFLHERPDCSRLPKVGLTRHGCCFHTIRSKSRPIESGRIVSKSRLSENSDFQMSMFYKILKSRSHLTECFPIVYDRDSGAIANNLKPTGTVIVCVEKKTVSST